MADFERRPILFLIGVQFEASLQRGDARVKEGGSILGAETTVLFPLRGIVRDGEAPANERRQSKRGHKCDRRKRCFHGTNLLHVHFVDDANARSAPRGGPMTRA